MNEIKELGNIRIPHKRKFDLGMEDVNDPGFISRAIDSLIRFLTRFMKDLMDGTAGMSMSLGRIHNRAEQISTESRARGRINRTEEFIIQTRIKNLCVNYRPINDPQQLLMFTKGNGVVFKSYFKYQNLELPGTIPYIVNIDPVSDDAVMRIADILQRVAPITKARSLGMSGDASTMSSVPLFGNLRLHATSKSPGGDVVADLAGQEWLLTAMSDNPKPLPQSIEYKVFASTTEQSILREVVSTVSDIEANFGIISRNRRSLRVDDLLRYLERLRNLVNGEQLDPDTLQRVTQIVSMLDAYNHWLTSPYLDLMSLYINNTSALLNVCEANN